MYAQVPQRENIHPTAHRHAGTFVHARTACEYIFCFLIVSCFLPHPDSLQQHWFINFNSRPKHLWFLQTLTLSATSRNDTFSWLGSWLNQTLSLYQHLVTLARFNRLNFFRFYTMSSIPRFFARSAARECILLHTFAVLFSVLFLYKCLEHDIENWNTNVHYYYFFFYDSISLLSIMVI